MNWELVKACTVAIATPEGYIQGTGFFISPNGHLLTCAHVVESAGGWEEVRVNGQGVELVYLGDRTCDDFAILQLSGYQGASVPLAFNFQPMDRFLSIGYGRTDFPQGASIDGTITDMNPQSEFSNLPMLRLRVKANSQQVQGGYSGSPVFDAETQRVIGIIAAYDNTEGALALPLVTVRQKWSNLSIFQDINQNGSPLNYDLRGYLSQIQQREWKSPGDTSNILQEILSLLSGSQNPQDFTPSIPLSASREGEVVVLHSSDPPLPIAEPELPEGQVDLASEFYIERPPIESRCYEAILKPGSLIRIKAPRQMGKTSLMARILYKASQQGCLTVPLSFQLLDGKDFADLDNFLKKFCASVGRRLGIPNKLGDYWDEIFGSKDNCTIYFEECLLAEINQPLVLGLDEVDLVFQHPEIAADFFGLLRAWHEDGKNREIWKKLRLVVVHSTEVYIPMNINQSPFNVGLPIELPEFNAEQVLNLAQRHGLNWSFTQVEQLMAMVGGHPFLVRMALYSIARQDTTLDLLLQTAPTEAGAYSDHLRRHLWNLEQRPELAAAIKKVVANTSPVRLGSIECFKLLEVWRCLCGDYVNI
ncbi:MAG: AAA-like domain-containing protein [Nostoc sp.]|uniref:AAA-like domain-containing protein n=1 Tax=Nostoc sp. TaxID=1180 RepID=UPI002FF6A02A